MTRPPEPLTAIAHRIHIQLTEMLDSERRQWAALDPALDEPLGALADLVLGGGKRIRPAYCYWGWILAGGEPADNTLDGVPASPADAAGCALELLHAFALVHDDVMDASPTRRGSPSVWQSFIDRHRRRGWRGESRRFGEAAAVLVGDMAMVLADRALSMAGPVPTAARTVWDTLRTELNMGQYLDIAGTARGCTTASQARTIIEHKTAYYSVVRPLQLGAAMAGRPDLADQLDRHGRPVGTAFQLRDDILGACGDPASTGKPVGEDLREGKPTLLTALARNSATPAQRETLAAAGPDMDDNTLTAVQQALADTGALASVEQEINKLLNQALEALEDLPDIGDAREALTDLAHYVVIRQS